MKASELIKALQGFVDSGFDLPVNDGTFSEIEVVQYSDDDTRIELRGEYGRKE